VHTEDVRRVLVIGSGTMGLQIGLQSATHGYDVVLYDASADALAAARNAFAPSATLKCSGAHRRRRLGTLVGPRNHAREPRSAAVGLS
jgi:3-hydroxyacyl-CoA dehydrogenase